jgi:competence protein ComEC
VLLLVTVVGFVVLARPSPSVLRAAGMGGVAAAAAAAARRPRGVPALAAAVVVLLGLHPWLARSPGFVLSAVATGALLLLAPRWADLLARRMPRPLALALAAPAAAQVACAPVVVLLQPAVSVVAVPANLVADPAVAPATVAGVVAAVVGTFSPTVARLVAAVGALGTGWIALVAATASRLPFASAPWPPGVSGALLLAGLEAVGVAVTLAGPRQVLRGWVTGLVPRPSRRAALMGIGAAVALVVAGWAGLRPLVTAGSAVPPGWSVAMCDVGQGDATVLRSGADRAVLVDAGPEPALADACLRRLGVRHLDLVVLTHFHADHVVGLPGVLAGRDAAAVLVSPLGHPTVNAAAVQRLAAAGGLPVGVAWVGQQGRAGSGDWAVHWRVIAASGGAGDGGTGHSGTGHSGTGHGGAGEDLEGSVVNESTVALDVTVGGPTGSVRVVLLGDLETQGQQALARRLSSDVDALAGAVDVVKVAHHGSAKQSEDLYRVLGARVGLIGVGAGNDYGHPAPSALALLRRAGTAALRTDLSGDLVVQAGPGGALLVTTTR